MVTDSQEVVKIQRGPAYPSPSFPQRQLVQEQRQKSDLGIRWKDEQVRNA